MNYKKVIMIISVPSNDSCFDGVAICEHLNNEGGVDRCQLGFGCVEHDRKDRPMKPKRCIDLSEADQ